MALIFCPECGNQTSDQAAACPKCAYPISKINTNQTQHNEPKTNQANAGIDLSGLDYYYEIEFEEIYKNNESYKGRFNWWAFFFSWIWCFTKGAWAWALIIIGAIILGNVMFSREPILLILFGFGISLALGFNGTKIYYNVKIKNKQI